ncbi:peptide-methionine (R)-S-oxide reductase MsrB [Candidatus Mycobacterium wuenschmannii]|uniref:peptide-methionine (R)-S-oxide reductase n=1 Tax=Candidatus Mycobacterium wuenschmannii TaxID=3027808 RepID=A0ABY8VYF0_9MYCO|nr:peptide-methionine (R)-S-oxide reductase MsrB [Candidatus Mycobacterium wuenschmannii]WIM87173.1 peptide-methionine (R)-S-oxide reductase MsrB [Candidatus Mycobacterium wuenschmannii]
MTTRRNLLFGAAFGALAGAGAWSAFTASGAPSSPAKTYEVNHTDSEWQRMLSPAAYEVLRHADTERPYSSPLNEEHRSGTFTCAGCAQSLFASTTKFDSGTGWPSFYRALEKAVVEKTDNTMGMARTEVLCSRCGGHLGHVFDDGPQPTGLRYCMNGVAMGFTPA